MYVRSLVAASTKPSVSSLLAKPCGSLFSAKLASSFNGGVYSSWTPLRLFSGKTIDIPLPPLAESMDSGTLASWEKKVGDFCKVDETIAIVDTDKVSVDVRAPASGELSEQIAKQGDEIKVGDIIARLIPGSSASGSSKKEESAVKPSSPEISKKESPEPKKAVTLEKEVKPVKETEKESSPKKLDPPSSSQPSVPQVLMSGRTTKVVKMTPMRKKTAERLKDSQNTAASLTTFNEIDMSNLINMRNLYKDDFLKKHGVKLGFMSCFAAAAVAALKELPVVNGRIDAQQENIIYHDYIDLSVAVSSPRGLVVPVIRDVQNMTFLNIETEIMNLANKAKDNKLTLEEMSGGTFTITNGGVFGSMMSTPMINMPQSAILGMHAVKERAVVINGEIKVRPMMYVALTYDHRIIDGRESVTFLKSIKEKIEDPHRLLLNL